MFLVAVGAGILLVAGTARLPSGTTAGSLIVRGAIGLGIGLVALMFVTRMLRSLTEPPPALPPRLDARTTDVVYECIVCGTRVRLEVAATGKAPKHCGEEMASSLG